MLEIKIELSTSHKAKTNPFNNIDADRVGQLLYVKIPKAIFWKELFDPNNFLERVMLSGDGRLLMCGKVVIQLNSTLDEIDQIGVIRVSKDLQILKYDFLNLLDPQDRAIVSKNVIKQDKDKLVHFFMEYEP